LPRAWLQQLTHWPVVNELAMLTGVIDCHWPFWRSATFTKSLPVKRTFSSPPAPGVKYSRSSSCTSASVIALRVRFCSLPSTITSV
jgi:hypothetical protein